MFRLTIGLLLVGLVILSAVWPWVLLFWAGLCWLKWCDIVEAAWEEESVPILLFWLSTPVIIPFLVSRFALTGRFFARS